MGASDLRHPPLTTMVRVKGARFFSIQHLHTVRSSNIGLLGRGVNQMMDFLFLHLARAAYYQCRVSLHLLGR